MKDKKSKIQLIIIIVELIILISLSGYRVYEYIIKDKEEIKENENGNENVKKYKVTFDYGNNSIRSIEVKENEKIELPDEPIKEGYKFGGWLNDYTLIDENYIVKEDITLKTNWIDESINSGIKILVYQINIRKEANENSEDIGDVLLDETYKVLETVDSDSYTWYKIKQRNIVGYVANQKGENWVEYIDNTNNNGNNGGALYFYEKDNEIIALNSEHAYFEERKKEYDNNYKFISEYKCENCSIGEMAGDCSINGKYLKEYKNVIISNYKEDSSYILYDVYSKNVVETYDDLIFVSDFYVIVEKNNKYKIINLKNNIFSDYYDDIANAYSTFHSDTKVLNSCYWHSMIDDYDIDNEIVTYKDNNKYGILSIDNGQIILSAKYDLITIYKKSIIAKKNDLEYVIDKYGNMLSKGYDKIWYSNDNIIVTIDDGYANIIDYYGNSLLVDKIYLSNYETTIRSNLYDNGKYYGGNALSLEQVNDDVLLYVPVSLKDNNILFNYYKYIYNIKNNALTKEICVISTDEWCKKSDKKQ